MNKNIFLLIISLFLLPPLYFCSVQSDDDKKEQSREVKRKTICVTTDNKKIRIAENLVINFFCGRGCVPCNKVAPIVEAVAKKYKFTLKKYEVWYDDKNRELLLKMAEERNTQVRGVPVVIIENDVYLGVEKISRLEELIQKYKK